MNPSTNHLTIRGSLVALVTPMHSDGSIDWKSYFRLIDWHIEEGTNGLVIMGSTGESPTIPYKDHLDLIRTAVEHAAGRIPIIGGTGANSTREAIDLTIAAQRLDVAACLSVVPYYNRPTQVGLYRHFEAIARNCDVPLIVYDVPSRTITGLSIETILALAQIPNIVGLKDATGDLARANELFDKLPDGFSVYSGDDATAAPLILMGAAGNISVTANVFPSLMRDLCHAALQGDVATARVLSRRLTAINQALFIESNPIPVKWAMSQLGLIHDGIRLPLTPLSPQHENAVLDALHQAGLQLPAGPNACSPILQS